MAAVWNFCKSKSVCDAGPDEPKEEDPENATEEPQKQGHGGCGHIQPAIRKEGLKLFLQYKKAKDDDEVMHEHRRYSRCSHFTLGQGKSAGEAIVFRI
jgi:DNA-directed RNA polymerase II subunit RPB1